MSILFYRRPDYLGKPNGAINSSDCALYVERAKNSESVIPAGLSFDEIIKNKPLPPCSLNDFMDYLVYVEMNAENLQFFLWYKDYVKRFEALSEKEKVLSPPWVLETQEIPDLSSDPEKKPLKRVKRETLAKIMDLGYDGKSPALFTEDEDRPNLHGRQISAAKSIFPDPERPSIHSRQASAIKSTPAPPISESSTFSQSDGMKWQPFSIQPNRDEINRIMRHYLAFSGPRELNLSHKDRALCLHALQHTTHPSAFLPAVRVAEAALRGQSHPNFIRWSICNGNKPRIFFVRTMGVPTITLAFILVILLTLSRANRWWRIFAAIFWFIGISTMVAAYKGLCVILHTTHLRNLRPWEESLDTEQLSSIRNSTSRSSNRAFEMSPQSPSDSNYDLDKHSDDSSYKHASLSTFGPKNTFDNDVWMERYRKKSLIRKVFEKSVWTQDETLRVLQDRIVMGANLWAFIGTVILTVAFVALPRGNSY